MANSQATGGVTVIESLVAHAVRDAFSILGAGEATVEWNTPVARSRPITSTERVPIWRLNRAPRAPM